MGREVTPQPIPVGFKIRKTTHTHTHTCTHTCKDVDGIMEETVMNNSGLILNYYEIFIVVTGGAGLCPASFLHIAQYLRAWLRLSVTVLGPSLVLRFSGRGCITMGNW